MATKKSKKVETPIDQRETFVSIQKNFADSEISVEEKLRILYELQRADSAIDKIYKLRGELPREVDDLKAELASLKARIKEANERIEGHEQAIIKCREDEAQGKKNIVAFRAQLDDIENSRDYDAVSKDIENQEYEIKIATKHIGEARQEIIRLQEQADELKSRVETVSKDLEAKEKELSEIEVSTSRQERDLQMERARCASRVDERTMSAYNRIRESVRNHLAVVTVYEGACGGCFNAIIPQRLMEIQSNNKLIICEHCGRIIVSDTLVAKPEAEE